MNFSKIELTISRLSSYKSFTVVSVVIVELINLVNDRLICHNTKPSENLGNYEPQLSIIIYIHKYS